MTKEHLNKLITHATRKAYKDSKVHLADEFRYHFEQNLMREIGQSLTVRIPQRDVNRMCQRIWNTTAKMRKVKPGMKTGPWLKLVIDVVTKYLWDELF